MLRTLTTAFLAAILILATGAARGAAQEVKEDWPVVVNPIQADDPANAAALACRDASADRAAYESCLANLGWS